MNKNINVKIFVRIFFLGALLLLLLCSTQFYQIFLDETLNLEKIYGPFLNRLTLLQMLGTMSVGWVSIEIINGLGALFSPFSASGAEFPELTPVRKVFLGLIFIWFMLITYWAVFNPDTYIDWAEEDHPVETLSAGLYVLAAGFFFLKTWTMARWNFPLKKFYVVSAAVIGVVLFVMGMEEVSWFQRVFGVATPEILSANEQGEMNFHNLASDMFQIIFYFGAFAAFSLVPYTVQRFGLDRKWKILADFTPTRFVMLVGAFALGYNSDEWDSWIIQMYYFFAFFVLFQYGVRDRPSVDRRFFQIVFFCFAGIQFVMLVFIRNPLCIEILPEYKELFVSIALAVYGWEFLTEMDPRGVPLDLTSR